MCLSMKILSWNVCGLGGIRKRRLVRECIFKFNPTVIIIQETKKADMNQKIVKSSVGSKLLVVCPSNNWYIKWNHHCLGPARSKER